MVQSRASRNPWPLVVVWLIVGCGGPVAEVAGGVSPYLLSSAQETTSPVADPRTATHRRELEYDIRRLEQRSQQGQLDASGRRTLIEKRAELNRLDRTGPRGGPLEAPGDPVTGRRLLEPSGPTGANPILGR